MKRKIAVAITLLVMPSFNAPAQANPALIAPAAGICGATGVGCVLLGTVIISGIVYYVYTHNGQLVYVSKGNTRPTLEDPEEEDQGSVYPLNAKSWQAAKRECAYLMGYSKKFRVFQKKGRWYCTDKGV